jgi:hypothetical protein
VGQETTVNSGQSLGAARKIWTSKWFWTGLAVFVALQMYFIRELLAVFILFSIGFAVLAIIALAGYLVEQAGEKSYTWAEPHARELAPKLREGVKLAEELSKKPFHRPRSETAQ